MDIAETPILESKTHPAQDAGLSDLCALAARLAGAPMACVILGSGEAARVLGSHGMAGLEPDQIIARAAARGHPGIPVEGLDAELSVIEPDGPASREGAGLLALQAVARLVGHAIANGREISELSRGLAALRRSEAALQAANEQLGLDYGGLLDSMADGVLSIGPDQHIEVLNPVGCHILGVDAAEVVGRTLVEAFLADSDNDALVDAVLLPMVEQTDRARSTIAYNRKGAVRELQVASATYRLRFGPRQGKMGVITAFSDVTEVNALRVAEDTLKRQLQEEHGKLQTAYVTLEHAAAREKAVTRRSQVTGFGAIAAMTVAAASVGAYVWWPGGSVIEGGAGLEGGGAVMTVTAQPVSSRVAVVGTFDAGSIVNAIGPYDGSVKQVFFQYGGAVERGKPLLRLETAEVESSLREAETAEIRAGQKAAELRDWATGPDMSRARRAVSSGELDIASLRARAAQTKMLLGKGIVAADEYTQVVQQLRGQELQLQATRQDLQATQDRASEENRRIAEIELTNARAKLAGLRSDLSRAEVLAPVSGVVLQPPSGDGARRSETIAPGSRVSKGQTMLAIGGLETLTVRAKVDEIDVNKVRVGRAVEITGDALEETTLHGTVTAVAAQASGESAIRASMAAFPVTVEVQNLTDEQRARIHVGMSANVSIIAYENDKAIIVPVAAVQTDPTGRTIRVRRDGRTEAVPVTIGISMPDGVEIRSGLSPGDVIEIP